MTGEHTHSEEHRAGALTAPGPRTAGAQNTPLLGQQVEFEGLNKQVLAVRMVPHQALGIHVAQQEVSAQQGQAHTLHELGCRGATVRCQAPVKRSPQTCWTLLETCVCITPVRGSLDKTEPRCPQTLSHGVFPPKYSGSPRHWPHPWDVLPPSIHVMFDPAQDGTVDILL